MHLPIDVSTGISTPRANRDAIEAKNGLEQIDETDSSLLKQAQCMTASDSTEGRDDQRPQCVADQVPWNGSWIFASSHLASAERPGRACTRCRATSVG